MKKYKYFTLYTALLISALGWGISIVGYLVGPNNALNLLTGMAGEEIPNISMLSYWLSMASIGFTFIGFMFILAMFDKFNSLRMILGLFNIICAILLTIHNFKYGYVTEIQKYDSLFLASTGLVIAVITIYDKYTNAAKSE